MSDSTPNNITPSLDEVPATLRDLIDGYLADALSPAQLADLESHLKADPSARRFFVRYVQLHRDLHLEAHARRQADAALARIGLASDAKTADERNVPTSMASARRIRPFRWLAAAAVVALAIGAGWWMARGTRTDNLTGQTTNLSTTSRPATQLSPDIAWLVNAQNCQWTDDAAPADMKAGTVMKIERGLAEVKFRSGAAVLLEGPARLELLSDNSARLLRGRLTGKVIGPVKGFALFSPRGKVIDLGTEFGVAVADGGETDVYVFQGNVQAIGSADAKVLDLAKSQGARIDTGGTAVRHDGPSADAEAFVREIVPPPVIQPKTLRVNFGKGYEGTLADAGGFGTGLTYRLPGTGTKLAENDPNLAVNSDAGHLELTTTRSDVNGQQGLVTGEYLGVRLADLGFTGGEDFQVEVFIPNIPALQNVGQFGLYAGAKSDTVIRGGLISRGEKGYTLFMTNNDGGRDRDSHFLGLFAMGDDLRIRLKRTSGKYALSVDNLTTGASSTLAIRHPAYLDPQNDLYVGLFGANTGSEIRRTLFIKEFAVTVWTKEVRDTVAGAETYTRSRDR